VTALTASGAAGVAVEPLTAARIALKVSGGKRPYSGQNKHRCGDNHRHQSLAHCFFSLKKVVDSFCFGYFRYDFLKNKSQKTAARGGGPRDSKPVLTLGIAIPPFFG